MIKQNDEKIQDKEDKQDGSSISEPKRLALILDTI